jgi:hypothetical protein
VAWRVSVVLSEDGPVRERHVFTDLSAPTSQALCEHTAVTALLEPDDMSASLCHLCWLFFGTDLARRLGDSRWT